MNKTNRAIALLITVLLTFVAPLAIAADVSGLSTVSTGQSITAAHENSQKTAIENVNAELIKASAKRAVRAATTANITLSGTQTIDGVSVVAGDRVLVKDQSTGSQNGVYVCASGSWTRATDFDANDEVTGGMLVPISEGTANGNEVWQLTTNDTITIGSTSLTFAQIGGGGGGGHLGSTVVSSFFAYRSTNQTSVSSGTVIVFDTENYDNVAEYDNTTGIWTAAANGIYAITGSLSTTTTAKCGVGVYKNGSYYVIGPYRTRENGEVYQVNLQIKLSAGDTIKLAPILSTGSMTVNAGEDQSFFSITRID